MEKVEGQKVLIDTDLFIEFFRTRKKEEAMYLRIRRKIPLCYASAVTLFEFAYGSFLKKLREEIWEYVFQGVIILPVDDPTARIAAKVASQLKLANLDIGFRDSLVAATALRLGVPLASKNIKHFSRIKGLRLLELARL